MKVGDKIAVTDVPDHAAYLVVDGNLKQVELLALDVPRDEMIDPLYQRGLDELAARRVAERKLRSAFAAYRLDS